MKLSSLTLGILAVCLLATPALPQSTSGAIEQLPIRTLSHILGHDSGGFVGREPATDFVKPGSTGLTPGNFAVWGNSNGSLIIDGGTPGSMATQNSNAVTITGGSANFSGTATASTQSQGDNSSKLATTSYVDTGLGTKASLVGGVIPITQGGTGAPTAAGARTALGTAAAGANSDITSITGLTTALSVPQGGTGTTTSTGSGSIVLSTSPALITPNLGTPSAATLTNATGLPVSTGISGLGTGVATWMATPSSANLAAAMTNETGTGALVFGTSPTLVTPLLGTPSSGVMTNVTGLPLTTGVTGILPIANGGSGAATASANQVFAAPNGSSGAPSFRTLVGADLNYTASGTGASATSLQSWMGRVTYIDDYAANHNGTSDDATPLTNAMAALGSQGGKVKLSCAYNYAILSNVTIPVNVTVEHCNGKMGNPGNDWTTGPIASQPHINLSSSATITMSSNSGFSGVIINSAITPPVATLASYAGTAMKLGSGGINDVRIKALIVGFATCMDGTNGGDRQNWDIECDGNPATNVGSVIVGPSFDTSTFNIRTYPWGTVAYPTSPVLTRSGIGVQILTSTSDDDRFNILDFGHATGVQVVGNGNIHFSHIWTDNNATSGVDVNSCDRCTFDAIYSYATPVGVRALGSTTFSIGYLLCDAGTVGSSSCLSTASGVSPRVNINFLDVRKAASAAINIGSTTGKVVVNSASLFAINGSSGPYILGPANWTSNQVKFNQIIATDLPAGHSLYGGNAQSLPAVASAATLLLPAEYDHFSVTGTTTITNISSTWNDHRIILTFTGALTLTNNSNIKLTSGANLTTAAGTTIGLWYDQQNAIWREMWHN
ncbi:beta strand repeat-containing protein [Rhizobium rhizogenes]|uniref:beta strand repeat-containing protein n=1 Tax=Rhizobium rhizogenes TaxID=359 RepID=UPI001574CDB4|nr:hypothetical protein [Rhizobium rhizogenes]NTF67985.1 hypothetical protein [Rhizobium rhizogenes]